MMGYRFLDDYDPQKEQKKKQAVAQKAPQLAASGSGNLKKLPQGTAPAAQSTQAMKPGQIVRTVTAAPVTAAGFTSNGAAAAAKLPKLEVPKLTRFTASEPQTPQTLKLLEIKAFGAGDYTQGGKALERIAKTVAAGVAGIANGAAEIAGQFHPTSGQQSMGQFAGAGDLGRAAREFREKGTDISLSIQRQEQERREQQLAKQQRIFAVADQLSEKGAQYQQEAKEGLGTVGRFLVDMGVTGTQMAGDALMNLVLPGSGLAMMGMRSYGQAAGEARREGKDSRQQFLAGLKSAGIEMFTEKMFGAFAGIYGKAGADELVEKLVTKLTKNTTGQALLTWMVNAAGEGVEEVTSDLLNPLADRLLKLDSGEGPIYSIDDLAQWGYDFLLGTAMGALGGGTQLARGVRQGRAQTAEKSYYDDLLRNGLGSAQAAANAQRASAAMGRIMPGRDGLRMPQLTTYEQRQAAEYRGEKPQNVSDPRIGRLELSSEKYNPSGADISTVYGNRYRQQVKEDTIRRLGIADGKPAYLVASNITKNGQEYYVDVTKASLNKMLYTREHERLPLERILLVDNLEKAIDNSYWAESNGDRKSRPQIDGFDTLRTSFYIDGIPYYADIKVKVVQGKNGADPQNVVYFLEPEEITAIKRVDAPSPTGALLERNIVFRDGTSTVRTSVPQSGTGVNTQGMQNGGEYAANRLRMPQLTDEQGRTYEEERQAEQRAERVANLVDNIDALREAVDNGLRSPRLTTYEQRTAETQYSIRNTRTMPWNTQINSYFSGKLKSSDSLYLGTTGAETASKLGVMDAPLYLPTSVITKAERDSQGSRSAHSLERGDILALDEELRNSAAVVYNPARQSMVYLTTGTTSGKPLVVTAQVNTNLFGENAHKVTSIHNRESVAGLLQNLGTDAIVLIKNNSELNRLLPGTEIQSLQLLANVELADNTVPQAQESVNPLRMPQLTDEQGRTYEQRMAWQQIPEKQRAAFDEAQRIAQRFGAQVVVSQQEGVNGSYRDGVISLNPNAANPVRKTLIHELTHHMERSGLYGEFRDKALRYVAENMGADVDSVRQAVMADYARNGVVLDEDGATREIVAKFAEERLFTDETTVRRLLAEDRNLFQRIYDWIRDMAGRLTGTSEESFLRSAEKLYAKALRETTAETGRGTQMLFAGENARTANMQTLNRAQALEASGAAAEDIRRETGWFRGMDGKWRFEIDDSAMRYDRQGVTQNPDVQRKRQLEKKLLYGQLTQEETNELRALTEMTQGIPGPRTLSDYIQHDALFEAYPELRDAAVVFEETEPGVNGYYNAGQNTIVLDSKLRGAPESTLVHEIQHAVQRAEGFARGSTPEYWAARDYETGEITQSLEQEYNQVLRGLDSETRNKYLRYQEVNRAMENLESAEEGTPAAEKYIQLEEISDRLYTELWGIPEFKRLLDLKRQIDMPREVYDRFYRNTAGEIEARDAAARRGYDAEQRRLRMPNLGNANTVFAGGNMGYFAMSAEEQAGIREQLRRNSDRLKMANAEMNTVGAVTNNSQLLRGSAPAINSASEFSIPNNSGNVNTEQYSTGRGLDDLAGSSDYLDALARDENMFTSDAYTLADRLYDLQLRRAQQQEAPPERPAEQVAREDLDEIAELFTDQGNFFASREDRIRETENMVTDHTIEVGKSRKEKATEAWSYFYRKMVDAGHSVDKFAKAAGDPYLYQIYNQARASSSAGVSMITDAQTNVNAQKVGESLNGVFSPIRAKGEDYYRAFQLYMFDLHNIDRMSLSKNKEAAVLEATAALNEFDANHPEMRTSTEAQLARMTESLDPDVAELARERMQLLRNVNKADAIKDKPVFSFDVTADVSQERARRAAQEHPEFEQYRQQVRTYIDNLMQYRVDSGLMTQADADYLKRLYPNYVPTMRKGGEQAGAGRDRNAVRIGRTVGRAEGGTADLLPLHEALGRQTMKVVREGSKNRFGQRLLDDFVRVGENSPAARYVREAHEYEHEFTPDTLDDMSRDQLTRDKTLTVFKDGKLWELTVDDTMFDALKALSPDAAESNAVTRAIRTANNLFKSLVTGYNPTFTIRNTVRDLQTAGLYTRDAAAFARNYPKALAEIKNNGQYWQMYKALGGSFSSVFDYNTGTVREPKGRTAKLMAKIEALNMTMEQAPRLAEFMSVVEKGGTSQENLADALYAAADVTVNFGRAGTLGKVLNANYVPFLNPGIQGFDKLIRRVTETKGGREWAKLIIRAMALGVAPSLLNALLYHDDEEWDDLRDSDKDTNYLFKLGNGTWLKIPKGRELSLLGITADRIGDALRGENVDLIATINTMGNQVAPANPLTSNIASALFEAQLFDPSSPGRTWYGGDIENQRLQSYAPGQRYDSSTDVFSKAVGGALGISPKKLNYVLDQYSGVVGDFLLPLLTPQAERGMFSKAFTVDAVTSNRLSGDFYDESDALTYAKNDGDEAAAVVSRFWSKQQSACSDLYKQIREVEASDLSDREKRRKTRELKALVNGIQKNAMAVEDTYRAAVEKNLQKGMNTDDAYRAANKDCFGAEYALQVYSKDVYEKAKNAKSNGVSYDDYYAYYFGTKGLEATDETSVTTQKFEWLQSSGMSPTSQAEIYFADMASDKVLQTQAELEISSGITAEQFYQYKVASSGMTKKAEKMQAINSMDLTAAQKDAIYYAEGWAQSTIGQAPWRGGYVGSSSRKIYNGLTVAEMLANLRQRSGGTAGSGTTYRGKVYSNGLTAAEMLANVRRLPYSR